MHEHPSVSQTFVVTEAAEVERLGIPVVGYALKRGSAPRPAASLELLCAPPSRRQLAWAALIGTPHLLALPWRAGERRLSLRESKRLALAHLHATHALRQLRNEGLAHIHAHFLGRSADVAMLMAARLDCDWSVTAHAGDAYSPAEPALLERRLATAAAVACASRSVHDSLRRRLPTMSAPTAIVHCGVDTSALHFPVSRKSNPQPHLVTVGRLVATKGHWTIIESADALMRADGALRWTVVGDGPLQRPLIEAANRRGLTPRLSFVGALAHDAILTLLRDADGFVLPCEEDERGGSDGIPVALMEAMALGVPVVTSPVGGIRELVESEATGFLVPPGDSAALTAVVERIVRPTHPAEIEAIRVAARTKVEQEFDLVAGARRLIRLLDSYLP